MFRYGPTLLVIILHFRECFSEGSQAELVRINKKMGFITSKEVEEVLLKVDRKHYLPSNPYQEYVEIVGDFRATFSPPHVQAAVLETLRDHLKEGNRVLDVGSGTGYLTACMALMVGSTGYVVGVDHIEGLVDYAKECIMRDNPSLIEDYRVRLYGDGRFGMEREAPYDAINIGAVATQVPEALFDQLIIGGRLVMPTPALDYGVDFLRLSVYDKLENGTISEFHGKRIAGFHCEILCDKNMQLYGTKYF